jgi:hypothetical protein
MPDPTATPKTMARIKFQKFSNNGKTYWWFSYTDPATCQQYGYQIVRGTIEMVKRPGFYNDRRSWVAKEILMIRHKFRILRQELANA